MANEGEVNTTSKEQSHSSFKLIYARLYLTTQFPSHGLGEPMAYGFQTFAKGVTL